MPTSVPPSLAARPESYDRALSQARIVSPLESGRTEYSGGTGWMNRRQMEVFLPGLGLTGQPINSKSELAPSLLPFITLARCPSSP
jgi:hypothetical protein